MMWSKLFLYLNTIRYLRPSQVYHRARKLIRLDCPLGAEPGKLAGKDDFLPIRTVSALDFDPIFLARFSAEEFAVGRVTFLHATEDFCWNGKWELPDRAPLWNYNLHYFEFLFPLVKAYKESHEERYLAAVKDSISGWIASNSREDKGLGWDPYPIALRLTNWLSFYAHLPQEISKDAAFQDAFVRSVWGQYDHLAHHLEKDLLGNHYFEDLKALVLCALFFGDEPVLAKALKGFKAQCREQILPDGMHFELSPMYHKIILEDVLRVAAALRGAGKADAEIEGYIQPMLDVAYSLEEGLERIPLFNDCGDNVAKSLDALCLAAKVHFGIEPHYKAQMPDSGYYIFRQDGWKLIVDAGQPGPKYIPGHAHCDAMSFELFRDGKPVIVNCGTYAYQCEERSFFRSTVAHNTVQVDGVEQSQCWGAFRVGKRSRVFVQTVGSDSIAIKTIDHKKNTLNRKISFEKNRLLITDEALGKRINVYFHDLRLNDSDKNDCLTNLYAVECETICSSQTDYSPEFGLKESISVLKIVGEGKTQVSIVL